MYRGRAKPKIKIRSGLIAISEIWVLEVGQILIDVSHITRNLQNLTHFESVFVVIHDRSIGLGLGGDLLLVSANQ